MPLPRVVIRAAAGDAPLVTVDGVTLPGVRSTQIHVAQDRAPQVALVLAADAVDAELPAGVTVMRQGGGAGEFADGLNPARLQTLALQVLDHDPDVTQGEAFAAALVQLAEEWDATRG